MEIQYWWGAVIILRDESGKVIIFPFDPTNGQQCRNGQQCPLSLNMVVSGTRSALLVFCTGGNNLVVIWTTVVLNALFHFFFFLIQC